MTKTTSLPLLDALAMARQVRDLLDPACERIEIAGSIRRKRPFVHDIEIVALPRLHPLQVDFFGEATAHRNLFNDLCSELRANAVFSDRPDKNGQVAWGSKYKRARYQDTPLDLFSASPDNWGLILLIRTGPADFNKRLVRNRNEGGLMPSGMKVQDGYLWRGDERLLTPEERDVFTALTLNWIAPEERQ